ncbi:hypothetical protein RvY_10247 [Ramazzottius varieornatus]|uniref:Transmembrane protein 177 n=1 Tax=Ramazzottius varieornatus TaxID=947166 RepID=A0A1D1VEL5_RAMVA|nr:hypothetical protein RvY_10247 [Ramazzottius varieornatus]
MDFFSRSKPFLKHIVTEDGRRHMSYVATTVGLVITGALAAPHTFLLRKSKDQLQMYSDGYPVKPSPALCDIIAETLADYRLPEDISRRIRWFTAFGFDPIHMGALNLTSGAVIGLPKTFSYTSVEDVDRSSIKMHRDKSVPWRTEAGEALLNSLILSKEAKKFAIAREVIAVDSTYIYFKTLALATVFPIGYKCAVTVNDTFGLFRYPRKLRVSIYAGWSLLGILVAIGINDAVNYFYDKSADKKVAALGYTYCKGGVEYHSKRLLRNRALRELLGREGQATYSTEGNMSYWIRMPHPRCTSRRDFFQKEVDRLEQLPADQRPEPDPIVVTHPTPGIAVRTTTSSGAPMRKGLW